ncbi:hypothetical protein KP509_08G056300 [Ceratopteris richardii]|uniref:Uncharacterized protein n=1 Tax=Ceratopteris richardii TaxID=49495 RepID=A0A8T2UAM8_CERRI|nr:hypothetical protein KP509_08G056300 [Ceratopteris richardii]
MKETLWREMYNFYPLKECDILSSHPFLNWKGRKVVPRNQGGSSDTLGVKLAIGFCRKGLFQWHWGNVSGCLCCPNIESFTLFFMYTLWKFITTLWFTLATLNALGTNQSHLAVFYINNLDMIILIGVNLL